MPVKHKILIVIAIALMGGLLFMASAFANSAYSNDASLLVRAAAVRHHVPVDFALRVARAETGGTGGRCGLRGAAGEVGPLQIKPATARGMGYKGVARATCEAQTDAGMAHLAECYRAFHGIEWMAAACHNQGHRTIQTKRFSASAKRYAAAVTGTAVKTTQKAVHVTIEAAAYPVMAFSAPGKFMRLVMPQTDPAVAVKPKKARYRCNWSNCPNQA